LPLLQGSAFRNTAVLGKVAASAFHTDDYAKLRGRFSTPVCRFFARTPMHSILAVMQK
jgi:hypothetical protein